MKLLTFSHPRAGSSRFGVLLGTGHVLDLTATSGARTPGTLMECIAGGQTALGAVSAAVAESEAALQRDSRVPNVYARKEIAIEVPLRPGKIMAVGKNYADHVAEGLTGKAYKQVAGFIKLSSCVVAHDAPVFKPSWTQAFDYENELAVVIGRTCCDVPPENAYDCVFGYTIMNDLSCRDVQKAERAEGNICIGKNFPTSAPLGPWIVTKDEIPDPHDLRIVTRVNGEVRQNGNTAKQIYRIPAQIAWYSHAGLEPGDIISTGTPAGCGIGYKGPGTWYLSEGDRLECEIEKIGVLINRVAERRT